MVKVGIDAAERALIKGCAEQGVGIDDLGNGSTFRFVPAVKAEPSGSAKPTSRGSTVSACQPWAKKLKNWRPARMSLDPMYNVPMAGDDDDLTYARRCYHRGQPEPLRAYLKSAINKN